MPVSLDLLRWYRRKDDQRRARQDNAIQTALIRAAACSICGVQGHSADQCDEVAER